MQFTNQFIGFFILPKNFVTEVSNVNSRDLHQKSQVFVDDGMAELT